MYTCPECGTDFPDYSNCKEFEILTKPPDKHDERVLIRILFDEEVITQSIDGHSVPIVIKKPVYLVAKNTIVQDLRDELKLWQKEANSYKERIRDVSDTAVNRLNNEINVLKGQISNKDNSIIALQNGLAKLLDSERNAQVESKKVKDILDKFQTVLGTLKFKEILECSVVGVNVNTLGNRELDLGADHES